MKKIETLSINDAIGLMRDYGLGMSHAKITAWIDANRVPWALSAQDQFGQPQRTIFKKPLIEWLVKMSEGGTVLPSKDPDLDLSNLAVKTL